MKATFAQRPYLRFALAIAGAVAISLLLLLESATATGDRPASYKLTEGTTAVSMTAGPDGNLWFTTQTYFGRRNDLWSGVGRITPTGQVAEYTPPSSGPNQVIGGIAVGPDGNLWFAEMEKSKIGRITTTVAITEFPLPSSAAAPRVITAGPDDALWFVAAGDRIGRIETDGDVTSFPLPPGSLPSHIAAGPDGALWITEQGSGKIARMTTGGAVTEFPLPDPRAFPAAIVAGPTARCGLRRRAFRASVGSAPPERSRSSRSPPSRARG